MLVKYKNYINLILEKNKVKYNNNILNKHDAYNYIKKNCNDWINNPKTIYRVLEQQVSDFFISTPIQRKSKDNKNFYTLIIDNDPRFSNFPKRSKSFICSLNEDSWIMRNRETLTYNVIPVDNSNWGVLNTIDIYYSFDNKIIKYTNNDSIYKSNLIVKLFNNMLDFIDEYNFNFSKTFLKNINDSDYHQMINDIKYNDKIIKQSFKTPQSLKKYLISIDWDKNDIFFLILYYNWDKSFIDIFLDIISPDNMQVMNYTELESIKRSKYINRGHISKEIWTESTCLFVNERLYDDIFDTFHKKNIDNE